MVTLLSLSIDSGSFQPFNAATLMERCLACCHALLESIDIRITHADCKNGCTDANVLIQTHALLLQQIAQSVSAAR